MRTGKTTLLKLLEGELQVDAGAIFTPAHLARRLVTAKEKNTVHGTVLENVLFGGDPLHAARSEPTWTVQQLRTSAEQHGWSRSGSASSARVRALLEALDESSEARKELAIEMKKLGTEELGEMAREFGLHRNGKATMVQMLEADVDTLSTTQCMIVAVVRAILAGTDFLLLDGIFDQLHSSTLTSLVQALMHWQETHSGMGSTGCGDSPKTILVAVRNSLMPATVLELCPSVTTVETFVSHSLRDGGDDAGGGQAVLPQLSTDVPPVPDADADAEAQRPEEAMPPSLPPTPDDIAANP
jgi:ABC-type branched-subunit amino acid transport system ATPase component